MKKIVSPEIIDKNAVEQFERCFIDDSVVGILTADAHKGYRHPIGGVVGYKDKISLSGVGYDIGCGNNAVKTSIKFSDANKEFIKGLKKFVQDNISFGVGRENIQTLEHPVLDKIHGHSIKYLKSMFDLAHKQLGTVGSGNHYVDVMHDQDGYIWITNHFGSRGFGHKTTTGFISLYATGEWSGTASEGDMDLPPILFDADSELGRDYFESIKMAGEYAQAGRDWVIEQILNFLQVKPVEYIRNHHNFCWQEDFNGENYYVVRKGATPVRSGDDIYIGGSMATPSFIVTGKENTAEYLNSAPHGAGRVMGRGQAKGRIKDGIVIREPLVNENEQRALLQERGVHLYGGDLDEMPVCYKDIEKVINSQDCYSIKYKLTPFMVFMADKRSFDPYKD